MEVISDLNSSAFQERSVWSKPTGTDIVHILENEHQLLYPWGNSPGEIDELSKAFKKYHASANLRAFLGKYGVEDTAVDEIQANGG